MDLSASSNLKRWCCRWHWWADVPIKHHYEIYALPITTSSKEPSVKYRGIFINDEAPALTGMVLEKFGSFGKNFYAKVFDLLLRLKVSRTCIYHTFTRYRPSNGS